MTLDAPLLLVVVEPLVDEVLEASPLLGALEAENLPVATGLLVVLESPPEDPLPAIFEAVGPLFMVLWVGPLLAVEGVAPLLMALRVGPLLAALGVTPLLTALRVGPLLLTAVDEGALLAEDAAKLWPTAEPADSLPASALLEFLLR